MTPDQKALLECAGWTVMETGFWKSPLTGRAMDERSALAVLSIKPRGEGVRFPVQSTLPVARISLALQVWS